MFNTEYIHKYFPYWDVECVKNCIDNRLSGEHTARLSRFRNVYCTLEHMNYLESARRIAECSLVCKNIRGIHFDDFSPSCGAKFIAEIHDTVKSINPELTIAAVTYSHQNPDEFFRPYLKYFDTFSRWCRVPSLHYWDHHGEDIRKLRELAETGKKILQGIYIHDFGSDMQCRYPVPLDVFKKSVMAVCEHTFDGTLDGFIIPQTAWFSDPGHYGHITWMKQYLDWFDSTTTWL